MQTMMSESGESDRSLISSLYVVSVVLGVGEGTTTGDDVVKLRPCWHLR